MPPPKLEKGRVRVEQQGYCLRCAGPHGTTAIVVNDEIAFGLFADGENCLGHERRWTAVCEDCVMPAEAAEDRMRIQCAGCGLDLSVPHLYGQPSAKVCSRACLHRALRKSKRPKQRVCGTCKTPFISSRRDARFCSAACRQWAYRLRSSVGEKRGLRRATEDAG